MGNGRSGGWPAVPIEPTAEERAELERMSRQRIAPHREVIRARALLMAAADARAIGRAVSVSDRTFSTLDSFRVRGIQGRRQAESRRGNVAGCPQGGKNPAHGPALTPS